MAFFLFLNMDVGGFLDGYKALSCMKEEKKESTPVEGGGWWGEIHVFENTTGYYCWS